MSTLEVVSSVLTVVMAINGFFLSRVYSDMQYIKIELAKLTTSHDDTRDDTKQNSKDIVEIRERLHNLEGMMPQLLSHLEKADE